MDSNNLVHHSNFHPSDAFVFFFTVLFMPFISYVAKFMNENTGVFVSFGALLGMAYTTYKWRTVYNDRKKLNKIIKLDNRDLE